jgi:hypothetical protein
MSGARPKRGGGPDRPNRTEPNAAPEPDGIAGGSTEPPALTARPLMEGRGPKIIMLVVTIIVGLMFIIAFSLCLVGGIKKKEPRYFLLLINIILSTGVTGLLIFWFYRRVLGPALLWYVFLQCLFLFFQCVTTDIFALYEPPTTHSEPPVPWSILVNATPANGSNNTTIAIARWPITA